MLIIRTARFARWSAALMVAATFSTRALAAEDVLTLLPDKTLGFAVVNRLSDVSEKLGRQARELGFPLPDPLALAKANVGIEQELDGQGTLLVAFVSSVDGSRNIEDSEGLMVLPVSDYKQFVGQTDGGASSEITEMSVAGQTMLVAEKLGYAVLVPSDAEHRSLLEDVLEREVEAPPEIGTLDEWIGQNDAAVVVLSPGIRMLTERGIVELEKIREKFSEMTQLGDKAGQVAASLDMYLQLLRMVKAEVRTVADGLRIDKAGNIRLGGRVRFLEGGQLAKIRNAANGGNEDLLAGLPGGPFVGVVGASLSPEWGELVAKWSVSMMKNNPALYGMELSGEVADKYLEAMLASMEGFHGFSMMMGPGEEGGAILDGILGIFSTDDATDYLAKYEQAMHQFQELIEESGSAFPYEMKLTKVEIAGAKGLKLAMDMGAALTAQGTPPEATRMLERMFGEGGKLNAHILAVDQRMVLFSYGSEKTIERQIAALKSGDPGLAKEACIEKTALLLPEEAGLVAYLSPRGAIAWAKNVVTQFVPPGTLGEIPQFPDTPAVGFSAKMVPGGLETELVVPAELPKVVKAYVESVRQ